MCTLKAYWEFKAEKDIVSKVVLFYTGLVFTSAIQEHKSNTEENIFAKCYNPVI